MPSAVAAVLLIFLFAPRLCAQPPQPQPVAPDRMEWFRDAKLGIFIHWGVYSQGVGSESWAFHDGETTYEAYMAQAATFTAANYHPEEWARLFSEAGARYAVLTSKHHDGFALWDTKLSRLNAKDSSPAGRDLVGPYCDALRKEGLRVGLYFSNLDWSHPDYASVLPTGADRSNPKYSNRFGYPQGPENPEAWKRFLAFHRGQLKEIESRYHPDLDLVRRGLERTDAQWQFKELREQLNSWNPQGTRRTAASEVTETDLTPEQYIPLVAPKGSWGSCA